MSARPHAIRVYADTSVFGGCFDEEFATESRAFFMQLVDGRFHLLLGEVTEQEIVDAPLPVQAVAREVPSDRQERCAITDEVSALRDAYIEAGVLGERWSADAMHVTLATIYRAEVVVSWNFKHLVNIDRIRGFHSVNIRLGYPPISIYTPREVISYADEDV